MFAFGDKCHRIKRLLSEKADGPISAKAEKKISAHLEDCADCRAEYAFYIELKEAATEIEKTPPPSYLWERISVGLDEHPWGEEESSADQGGLLSKTITGKLNFAGAMLSLVLVAVLSLSPGGLSPESGASYRTASSAIGGSSDIEYVSLYLMANQDRFPSEVRHYYLGHMEGLNQKIKTIKSALVQYPENHHIKAQLAKTYRKKIELYQQMGLSHANTGGASLPGDFSGEEILRGGCYE